MLWKGRLIQSGRGRGFTVKMMPPMDKRPSHRVRVVKTTILAISPGVSPQEEYSL